MIYLAAFLVYALLVIMLDERLMNDKARGL